MILGDGVSQEKIYGSKPKKRPRKFAPPIHAGLMVVVFPMFLGTEATKG